MPGPGCLYYLYYEYEWHVNGLFAILLYVSSTLMFALPGVLGLFEVYSYMGEVAVGAGGGVLFEF